MEEKQKKYGMYFLRTAISIFAMLCIIVETCYSTYSIANFNEDFLPMKTSIITYMAKMVNLIHYGFILLITILVLNKSHRLLSFLLLLYFYFICYYLYVIIHSYFKFGKFIDENIRPGSRDEFKNKIIINMMLTIISSFCFYYLASCARNKIVMNDSEVNIFKSPVKKSNGDMFKSPVKINNIRNSSNYKSDRSRSRSQSNNSSKRKRIHFIRNPVSDYTLLK
jgi:hypothetical protein